MRISAVDRADLCHENFLSLRRGNFESPKDKFKTNEIFFRNFFK